MNLFKKCILLIGIIAGVAAVGMPSTPTYAKTDVFGACTGDSSSAVCASKGDQAQGLIKNIVNLLIYLTGAIAVIMIIIGGIRYVTSNGDSSGVSGAKNTILYAVVGLVIAVMAYSIVNFVLTNIT